MILMFFWWFCCFFDDFDVLLMILMFYWWFCCLPNDFKQKLMSANRGNRIRLVEKTPREKWKIIASLSKIIHTAAITGVGDRRILAHWDHNARPRPPRVAYPTFRASQLTRIWSYYVTRLFKVRGMPRSTVGIGNAWYQLPKIGTIRIIWGLAPPNLPSWNNQRFYLHNLPNI